MKDCLGKEVKEGDRVVLLIKDYGYKKISDAYLSLVTYEGKGQWGEAFKGAFSTFYVKQPQCVKV